MRREPLGEIACGFGNSYPTAGRQKIQDSALGFVMGMEAAVDATIQVDRKGPMALTFGRSADRTRSGFLRPEAVVRFVASQCRGNISHGYVPVQTGEVASRSRMLWR